MGEITGLYRVLVGKLEERDHLEDPGVDRRIIATMLHLGGPELEFLSGKKMYSSPERSVRLWGPHTASSSMDTKFISRR
jgi:hypothetical protein